MSRQAEYQRPEGVRQAEYRTSIDARRSDERQELMRLKRENLTYQCAVNAMLVELDGQPSFPMLSPDEVQAMDAAFDTQVTVVAFVTSIRRGRAHAALIASGATCERCQQRFAVGDVIFDSVEQQSSAPVEIHRHRACEVAVAQQKLSVLGKSGVRGLRMALR